MRKSIKVLAVTMALGMVMNMTPSIVNAMMSDASGYHEVRKVGAVSVPANAKVKVTNEKMYLDADYTGVDCKISNVQVAGKVNPLALQVYQKKTNESNYKKVITQNVTPTKAGNTYSLGGYVNYKNGGDFVYYYNTNKDITKSSVTRQVTVGSSVIWYNKIR